jgi:hypothetical protein
VSATNRSRIRAIFKDPRLAGRYARSGLQTRIIGPATAWRRPGGVAMFHIARCGSTVLTDQLGQNTRIYWDGETYGRTYSALRAQGKTSPLIDSGFDPADYVIRRRSRSGGRWFGFDLKFHQLTDFGMELDRYVALLRDAGIDRFVVLRRRNHLRRMISAQAGWKRGRYHMTNGPSPDVMQVEIAVTATGRPLATTFGELDAGYDQLERLVPEDRRLALTYEDHVESDPSIGYQQVCEFLGLPSPTVDVRLRRSNPFAIADMVTNFDEVEAELTGTPYAWMLDG